MGESLKSVLCTDFSFQSIRSEGLYCSYFLFLLKWKMWKGHNAYQWILRFRSWFRSHSLPLCKISFFINFLIGHKYSFYDAVFCRYGKQVIELLWRGVEWIKQKERKGMKRAHRYDSFGNSDWQAFWWLQKLVWCMLVESCVSASWWLKAFVNFLGLVSMATVLKIHSKKMSWRHK